MASVNLEVFADGSDDLDVPRDLVMQGVGWLAREGKIEFQEGPRSKLVSLI